MREVIIAPITRTGHAIGSFIVESDIWLRDYSLTQNYCTINLYDWLWREAHGTHVGQPIEYLVHKLDQSRLTNGLFSDKDKYTSLMVDEYSGAHW